MASEDREYTRNGNQWRAAGTVCGHYRGAAHAVAVVCSAGAGGGLGAEDAAEAVVAHARRRLRVAPTVPAAQLVRAKVAGLRHIPPDPQLSLATDQSDTGSAGLFSGRTHQTQEARLYSHDGQWTVSASFIGGSKRVL
eukprot:1189751-Prorocentrum_minimum.AAC.3